jgi:hypothetical protein
MKITQISRYAAALFLGLVAIDAANPAVADSVQLYPKGQRASLAYTMTIEGDVDHRPGRRDEFYIWSTRRTLTATLEMEAQEAQKQNATFLRDVKTARASDNPLAKTMRQGPDDEMLALQKQMKACPQNDTACQMQLAMKMMGTGYMQQQTEASAAQQKLPARYQLWQVAKTGKASAKAVIDDHWEQVYYEAGREHGKCHLALQQPFSENDRQRLDATAGGFMIEVDGKSDKQRIFIPAHGDLPSQMDCLGIAGSDSNTPEKHSERGYRRFFPKMDVANGLTVSATGRDKNVISSGELTIKDATLDLPGNAPQRETPVRITVKWKLTKR